MASRYVYDCGCAACGDVISRCDQHRVTEEPSVRMCDCGGRCPACKAVVPSHPAHESCETCVDHSGGAFMPAACDIGESMADGGCAWWEDA